MTRGRGGAQQQARAVNRNPQNTARGQIRALRRELHGHKLRPQPAGPPQVNLRPWYPLVVDINMPTAATDYQFGPNDIIRAVRTQLGFGANATVNLRVKRFKAWAYQYGPGLDRVAINADVSSLIPSVSDLDNQATVNPEIFYPLAIKLQDKGNLESPAAIGYEWPMDQQLTPIGSIGGNQAGGFTILSIAANTANATLHFHVEWSSTGEAVPQPANP
jgi:hypothetical protein